MSSTTTNPNGTLNKQKSSSQKHTHKFKKWRQQKPTHTAHRAHQKIAWNSKKWRTKFNTQIFEMMWKCIWLKSLVNLGRTCLMKERCTTWKTWFWQFLGFQKMTEKLQHSNLWNDVKMHMIEVSWASEANLSHERKVYNLAERKMVRYCQNVHWCMSQYLKMSWMPLVFGQLCISEMNVFIHSL